MATMACSPVGASWKNATCSKPSASTMSNTPSTTEEGTGRSQTDATKGRRAGTGPPVLTRGQQALLLTRAMTGWAEGILGAPLHPAVGADIRALLTAPRGV